MQLNMQLQQWPYALGEPASHCTIRRQPLDFQVDEVLGFEPEGEGEHCLLYVEKCRRNTADVAQALGRHAGVHPRDVGFCGLKDKHAVTRQWFSVGLAGRTEPDWHALEDEELRLIEVTRHRRKLRRGVHSGNRFRLRLSNFEGDRAELEARCTAVSAAGVPNYFGEQRFGRDGGNLRAAQAWLCEGGRQPRRQQRGHLLSAARSYLFNLLLAERCTQGSWACPRSGDVVLLAGSHSRFVCEQRDAELERRAQLGDISPGLPLWGDGREEAGEDIALEQLRTLQAYGSLCAALQKQGLQRTYRAARLWIDDFCWRFCDDGDLELSFELAPGGYATAVLRELTNYNDNAGTMSEQRVE
jgi:tRNA pseudouridine13 synthase